MSSGSAAPPACSPAPCGSWASPLAPETLVAGAVGISEVQPTLDALWWAESRPEEAGRTALMRLALGADDTPLGKPVEMTPPGANVRTTVHEYGGGAWWVDAGSGQARYEVVYYVEHSDQRLRRLVAGEQPSTLTPAPPTLQAWRYADLRASVDGHWIVCVAERHTVGAAEADNLVVAVATNGSGRIVELVSGADFYGSLRISPDGRRIAWVEWWHPNMPWDDTTLMTADLSTTTEAISVGSARVVAGGPSRDGVQGVAIVQPEFSPDGRLHYLSDRDDHWQLFVEEGPGSRDEPVLEVDGEIGYPPWVFGLSRYAFRANGEVVAARFRGGVEHLDSHPEWSAVHSIRTVGSRLAFVGATFASGPSVVVNGRVAHPARRLELDEAFLVPPEIIDFPTGDGECAHALFYAPANPAYRALDGERPPLVVLAHGGPTAAARSQLNLAIRFWTSRGFSVVDVNYRGSSGFGRAYRKRLDGAWGVVDVEDCVAAARFLVARGDVDPARLVIRGGSAGGFTVLCALAFHDTFTAGASLYGVADLEALATDTHKFESRYLDSLIGPWPAASATYRARSPIHHLDGFDTPMIVLQGSEDRIVPPNQSRMIVDALDARGVPVAYLEFDGEQHGFRKAETIITAQRAELAFYGRIFGFIPAGAPFALEIRNLG